MGTRGNFVLPRAIQDQYGHFKTVPVGTGPFPIKSYDFTRQVTQERNPNYYEMGIDGKALPYLDGVNYLDISDYVAQVAAMRSGQMDLPDTARLSKS